MKALVSTLGKTMAGLRNFESPDFYVVSSGGVGSKALIKGLLPKETEAELMRRHQHWRRPPDTLSDDTSIIYVFGCPMNAVVSFFGRRATLHDRHGFKGKVRPGRKDWPQIHCRNVGGDWSAVSPDWDLPRFLQAGRDTFQLQDHFEQWLNNENPKNILFIRYETLWSNVPAVTRFLGLPRRAAAGFPSHVTRTSDWRLQSEEVRRGLETLYASFDSRLRELPDVFTRQDQGARRADR